jgi:hypothetical protein
MRGRRRQETHTNAALKFRFFLAMTLFDLLITETSWSFPVFTGNSGVKTSQYRPKYMGSKRTLLGNAYGIKWGALGNVLGNVLRTWWTCWKHNGDLMGTHWEPKIFFKTNSPTLLKRKKTGSIACMLHQLIWRGRISILNYLCSSLIFA